MRANCFVLNNKHLIHVDNDNFNIAQFVTPKQWSHKYDGAII